MLTPLTVIRIYVSEDPAEILAQRYSITKDHVRKIQRGETHRWLTRILALAIAGKREEIEKGEPLSATLVRFSTAFKVVNPAWPSLSHIPKEKEPSVRLGFMDIRLSDGMLLSKCLLLRTKDGRPLLSRPELWLEIKGQKRFVGPAVDFAPERWKEIELALGNCPEFRKVWGEQKAVLLPAPPVTPPMPVLPARPSNPFKEYAPGPMLVHRAAYQPAPSPAPPTPKRERVRALLSELENVLCEAS